MEMIADNMVIGMLKILELTSFPNMHDLFEIAVLTKCSVVHLFKIRHRNN